MDLNGEYVINGKTYKGSEVADLYQDLISKNLKSSFESVQDMFEDVDGEIDYARLIEHLKSEMENRGLGQEYFDAIEPIKNPITGKIEPTLPLWHPLIAYKVESLLNSFFKNRVTKQKINGGNMVNATSFGTSQDLKYHIDKNGNYHVEALLPWWSKKYFPKDEQGNVNIENVPDELKNIIGYRIPTEDKYSIFHIKVKGFTDSAAGGEIILPAEATFLAGLDFDIDKLFMVIPSFKINMNGEAQYIKYIDSDSKITDIADLIVHSSDSFMNFVNEYVLKEDQELWFSKKEEMDNDIANTVQKKKEFSEENEVYAKIKQRNALIAKKKLERNQSAKSAIQKEILDLSEVIDEFYSYDAAIGI